MRVVIQRVEHAELVANGEPYSSIGRGLMVLVGIEDEDGQADVDYLAGKICAMRIFDDTQGVMNLSVKDVGGEIMAVSQFTLMASTKKGNRPSYVKAAGHEISKPLYAKFCQALEAELGRTVKTGVFGADMQITLLNNGPVTICMDTKNKT